jgi:hypothetical protein
MCFLAVPVLFGFAVIAWFTQSDPLNLMLLLPGLLAMPVYSMMPSLTGSIPLSQPTEEAKAAGRGLTMMGIIVLSMITAGLATFAWHAGYFWQFLVGESLVTLAAYVLLRRFLARAPWPAIE